MMKKYMIIMSFLIAWTTSLWAENSTLPLTVTPGADGSVHLVSAVPAEVTGSVISKGFEYRLKGTGAWTTVSAAGAFEADIAVPVGTHEFRAFAEVSGQGTLYSRTNQVMVVGGYDNNAGIEYPVEIPFTEYSVIWGTALSSTSIPPPPCQWTNFESNKVIVINSNEELRNYLICTDGNYPEIDFSKHSLLLVRGVAMRGIDNIDINLFKKTVHEYTLNVSIYVNATNPVPPWLISIITPKIHNGATITLNAQQTYGIF